MLVIEMEGSTSTVTIVSVDEKNSHLRRNYSKETFCSDSSNGVHSKCKSAGSILRKRQMLHPLLGSSSPYCSNNSMSRLIPLPERGGMSESAQKVMSARILRVKQLQNELSEAQLQLSELAAENRALRTLQKRQEVLLKRYESKQAALPQIMHAYEEEVRILSSRLKQARAQIRTLEERLRTRDNELCSLRDKFHFLEELTQNKNLRQRAQLQQRLELLQDQLQEEKKNNQLLQRRLMLEGKNYKHQLAVECGRHRAARSELEGALEKISQLELQLKKKDKFMSSSMPRPISLLSLGTSIRLPVVPTQSRTSVEPFGHSNHALEEEDERDNGQDYTESSCTDQHTNQSQISSLENDKEVEHINSSNVSMSLDYQTRRFQFSNQKKEHVAVMTTCVESSSDQSMRTASPDPALPEKKPCQETGIVNEAISLDDKGLESRRGFEQKETDSKISENNSQEAYTGDKILPVFVLNVEKEERNFNNESADGVSPVNPKVEVILDCPCTETRQDEDETQQNHSTEDTKDTNKSGSLPLISNKISSRRSSEEIECKNPNAMNNPSQHLDEISQSWENLQQRIKSDSNKVKLEVEKELASTKVVERAEGVTIDDLKKKALLETINVIDKDDVTSFTNKPSSLFVGSLRETPFIPQPHARRKQLLDELFPASTSN